MMIHEYRYLHVGCNFRWMHCPIYEPTELDFIMHSKKRKGKSQKLNELIKRYNELDNNISGLIVGKIYKERCVERFYVIRFNDPNIAMFFRLSEFYLHKKVLDVI